MGPSSGADPTREPGPKPGLPRSGRRERTPRTSLVNSVVEITRPPGDWEAVGSRPGEVGHGNSNTQRHGDPWRARESENLPTPTARETAPGGSTWIGRSRARGVVPHRLDSFASAPEGARGRNEAPRGARRSPFVGSSSGAVGPVAPRGSGALGWLFFPAERANRDRAKLWRHAVCSPRPAAVCAVFGAASPASVGSVG